MPCLLSFRPWDFLFTHVLRFILSNVFNLALFQTVFVYNSAFLVLFQYINLFDSNVLDESTQSTINGAIYRTTSVTITRPIVFLHYIVYLSIKLPSFTSGWQCYDRGYTIKNYH
jgi:hypothetical protein